MKSALKLVSQKPSAPAPYDEQRGRKRIVMLHGHLLAAVVRYVNEGAAGTMKDRIREASDLSGIPRSLIEVEIKR